MLHEILFAMMGKIGNIVIELDSTFKVNPNIDFLSSTEKELIEKLIILGYNFRKIKEFIAEDRRLLNSRIFRIEGDDQEDQFEMGTIGCSAYVRAVCDIVIAHLRSYEGEILQVEQKYLRDQVFTFSGLCVKFSRFYSTFPEIIFMFDKIDEDGLKGGQLVDFLYECSLNGDGFVKEFYHSCLEKCYEVLYNQTMLWVIHGKLFDRFDEFFIAKIVRTIEQQDSLNSPETLKDEGNIQQEEWDGIYSLRVSMIPKHLITLKTAEKVLFIGKSVRVMLTFEDMREHIYSEEIFNIIKGAAVYDFLNFQVAIEKIRVHIAAKFLKIFTRNGEIGKYLEELKNLYLMGKGEFYSTFIEESETLFKYPPGKFAEPDLNNKILQSTLILLNWLDKPFAKRIKFAIQSNGFEYQDFRALYGLVAHGNVAQKTNIIRFAATKKGKSQACIWHSLKQNIENGFDVKTAIRFRRALSSINMISSLPEAHTIPSEYSSVRELFVSSNIISFVIQNTLDVNCKLYSSNALAWKRNGLTNLQEIPEYIAIKIGFLERDITKTDSLSTDKYYPFVLVEYYSSVRTDVEQIGGEGGRKKARIIGERVLDSSDFNFREQDHFSLRIVYNRNRLSVYLWKGDLPGVPLIDLNLKLETMLGFDMGKAYVGFLPDGFNSSFNIDVLKWSISCFNVFNSEDPWNGLTINYKIEWPMNLAISSQVLERYSKMFRLLFPIKVIQHQLDKTWITINRESTSPSAGSSLHLFTYLSALRHKMSFLINSMWSYFHLDVLEVQYAKLKLSLPSFEEFTSLRTQTSSFLTSLYIQTFLSFPQITKSLFGLIALCKDFVGLVSLISAGRLIFELELELYSLQQKFDEKVTEFIREINQLNQAGSSVFLSQLLVRLNFNGYYESVANEMELEEF